jgi:hypothetical protein
VSKKKPEERERYTEEEYAVAQAIAMTIDGTHERLNICWLRASKEFIQHLATYKGKVVVK